MGVWPQTINYHINKPRHGLESPVQVDTSQGVCLYHNQGLVGELQLELEVSWGPGFALITNTIPSLMTTTAAKEGERQQPTTITNGQGMLYAKCKNVDVLSVDDTLLNM